MNLNLFKKGQTSTEQSLQDVDVFETVVVAEVSAVVLRWYHSGSSDNSNGLCSNN